MIQMDKLIFISVLVITAFLIVGCSESIEPSVTPKQSNAVPPIPAAVDVSLPEAIDSAIEKSQVVSIPVEIEDNCLGFVIGAPDEMSLISEIGAAWARPHPGPFAWGFIEPEKGTFDFSMADDYVLKGQQNNVAVLGTIWPFADWDQKACHQTECQVGNQDIFYPEVKDHWKTGIPLSRCAPCNYDDYQTFIKTLVERYDGDGVDDLPGLIIPIKYWEILNEPEMSSTEMTFYKGSQEDYVKTLQKSYWAIKTACPDCQVLHGGAAGTQSFMLNYWQKILELGGGDYFDLANVHYINANEPKTLNVADFKNFCRAKGSDKPVWLTEVEFGSETGIAESVTGALQAGAQKIFFTQFKVGQFGLPADGKYTVAYKDLIANCNS